MQTIHFIGTVFPAEFGISLRGIAHGFKSGDPYSRLTVKIDRSRIDVECVVSHFSTETDRVQVYVRVLEVTRGAVDVAAFAKGLGLTVVFESYTLPDGSSVAITIQNREFAALCTSFDADSEESFGEMVNIVLREKPLFMAFNEILASLTVPDHAPVGCARAIERLKYLLAPHLKPNQQWRSLQEKLQISKSFIDLITDESKEPRHGKPLSIGPDVQEEIIRRSWMIMNRFLEFRKRNNQPLPVSAFPILR